MKGEWTGGALKCTAIESWCLADPSGPNVEIRDCARTEGNICTATCKAGSDNVGVHTEAYRCGADRLWSPSVRGHPLVCERKCTGEPSSPYTQIDSSCGRVSRQPCLAECVLPHKSAGGVAEYTCQDGNWTGGHLECVLPCLPGQERTNETDDSLHCLDCDEGRFSSNGVECLACLDTQYSNKTKCYKCPDGYGPNTASVQTLPNTVCEVCAEHQLRSVDGVCKLHSSIPGVDQITDLWEHSNTLERAFEVASPMLLLVALLCLFGRVNARAMMRTYAADMLIVVASTAFLTFAITQSEAPYGWEILCAVVTASSVLPVPMIIRRYKHTLTELSDPRLPPDKMHLGAFGLCLFIFGLVDLVIDGLFTYSLWLCNGHREITVLSLCATATMLCTTAMTWFLGWSTLKFVVASDGRPDSPAKTWLSANPWSWLIVLCSSSRLNSMALLRLKLFNTMIIDFPDSSDHRVFHFLRNAGMFHYLIEDIPHAVVSLIALYATTVHDSLDECSLRHHSSIDTFFGRLPVSHDVVAKAALVVSLGSIIIGLVSKSMQQMTVTITAGDQALLPAGEDSLSETMDSAVLERPSVSESLRDLVSALHARGLSVRRPAPRAVNPLAQQQQQQQQGALDEH